MSRLITIVIPTAGQRPALVQRTLTSLSQCELPNAYHETVVVENGGRHGVEKIVSQFSSPLNARYMFVEQANKSAALNAALDTLEEGLIIFFDDDVRMSHDILNQYAAAAIQHGPAHFFGGPVNCDYEVSPPVWLLRNLPSSAKGWQLVGPVTTKTSFLGCNWAAFSQNLLAAGYFDTNVGPGSPTGATGQETNMQQRLRANGGEPVYLPDAPVWHYVPAERSNWCWGMQRAYREGLEKTILAVTSRRRLIGWPWYIWLCLCRVCGNGILAIAMCSKDRWYRTLKHYQRWRGARHGLRLALRGTSRSSEAARKGAKD